MIRLVSILAQTRYQNRLKGLRSAFDDKKSDPADLRSIVVFVAILAAVVVVVAVANRLRQHAAAAAAPRHPARLFNQVLKKLGIGLTDRLLMRFMARRSTLQQPTVIFFSRKRFDEEVGQWADSISLKAVQDYVRDRMNAVGESVFHTEDEPSDRLTAQG